MIFTLVHRMRFWHSWIAAWGVGWVLASFTQVQAAEVHVAVAANFAGPMNALSPAFSTSSGHTLKVSVGSTGKFYSQIVAGAPFEVLLAADDETPQRLIAEGLAVPQTAFTYAHGKLALWSAKAGLVDAQGKVLNTPWSFNHLAIANPKTAPYGRAALEALKSLGLSAPLAPRLVTGESIAQAYQFVATGNAELGFVAWSQIAVPGRPVQGSYWLVPASLYGPIRQDAVLLKSGEKNPAAHALLHYLRSEPAQKVIRSFGYDP